MLSVSMSSRKFFFFFNVGVLFPSVFVFLGLIYILSSEHTSKLQLVMCGSLFSSHNDSEFHGFKKKFVSI